MEIGESLKLEQGDGDAQRHGIHSGAFARLKHFVELVRIINSKGFPTHAKVHISTEFLLVVEI